MGELHLPGPSPHALTGTALVRVGTRCCPMDSILAGGFLSVMGWREVAQLYRVWPNLQSDILGRHLRVRPPSGSHAAEAAEAAEAVVAARRRAVTDGFHWLLDPTVNMNMIIIIMAGPALLPLSKTTRITQPSSAHADVRTMDLFGRTLAGMLVYLRVCIGNGARAPCLFLLLGGWENGITWCRCAVI